jgi:hypothetical protein
VDWISSITPNIKGVVPDGELNCEKALIKRVRSRKVVMVFMVRVAIA